MTALLDHLVIEQCLLPRRTRDVTLGHLALCQRAGCRWWPCGVFNSRSLFHGRRGFDNVLNNSSPGLLCLDQKYITHIVKLKLPFAIYLLL